MKATINFNLPEDLSNYHIHNQAEDLYFAVWEISHNGLRWFDDKDVIGHMFDSTDWAYHTDKNENPITFHTKIDDIDSRTMGYLMHHWFIRTIKESNVNLDIN